MLEPGLDNTAQITNRKELCNPVRKNQEPLVNKAAHLVCYGGPPGANAATPVTVRNQLGSQLLTVRNGERLCLPSQKRELPNGQLQPFDPLQMDHFRCYHVDPLAPLETSNAITKVNLKDQFGLEKNVEIGDPFRLCAPVKKVHNAVTTTSNHVVGHLVCYHIKDDPVRRKVAVSNQFENVKLKTVKPVALCVPSAKIVTP